MSYMKIHCDYCGGSWEVYEWTLDHEKSRYCPHYFSKIDEQTWKNQVLPAYASVCDANRELVKDFTGSHIPLFSVDVISDYYFRKRGEHYEES